MNVYTDTETQISLSPAARAIVDAAKARFKSWDEREMTYTGPEGDGKLPFLEVFEHGPGLPYAEKLAKAIARSWTSCAPVIYPEDILVGVPRPERPLREHFSWGIQVNENGLAGNAYKDKREELEARIAALGSGLMPLDIHHITDRMKQVFSEDSMSALSRLFNAGGYQGHTVPDYYMLLRLGIGGTSEYINKYAANTLDPDKLSLYRAFQTLLDGFSEFILGYAAEAERRLSEADKKAAGGGPETDAGLSARLRAISDNCRAIARGKPETFYQAAQLVWFFSLWDWVDCVGRFDQYMYPFYEKAVKEGDVYPAEDVAAAVFMKFSEHGVHNIPLGGVKADGSDASNELTYLMLQLGRATRSVHPRMVLRVHEGTPDGLLALAVRMWSEGMSDPTVASDPLIIEGLTEYGVSLEDARDYTTLGCQEIEIPGKSNFGCEDGLFNLAKVFEYTINDGCDRFDGVRIGLPTGHIKDYDSAEALFDAFCRQVRYLTGPFIEFCNLGQEIRAANYAKLFKSIFTCDCISRGTQLDAGGSIYNYGVIETAGASAVADSFAAIDKLVYREKRISPETLEAAIAADFKGFEAERQLLLNAPKYGNDEESADRYMARILDMYWSELGKYRSVRGGVFTGACSLLGSGIAFGRMTWAMPDGRHAGEELGNTIGPRTGADVNGLTAMLHSVTKLPLKKGIGGTTVNVLIPRSLMSTAEAREKIRTLIRTYLLTGGQMAQITTAGLEEMIDAQREPEKHGDLLVRVGGFSARFVDLDRIVQDEIIHRYGKN